VTIRRAVPADAAAIATVSVRGWQASYRGVVPDEVLDALSIPARRAAWYHYLVRELEGFRMWVIEQDGRIVGFTRTGPSSDADTDARTGQVFGVYVDPGETGAGLGRRLLHHALADLRERGFREATVWVFRGNERGARFLQAARCRPDGATRADPARGYDTPEERYRVALRNGAPGPPSP
jgi:L-amino acid N-acyltransferase YncA